MQNKAEDKTLRDITDTWKKNALSMWWAGLWGCLRSPWCGGRELGTGNMVLAPYEETVGMGLKKFFLTNAFN